MGECCEQVLSALRCISMVLYSFFFLLVTVKIYWKRKEHTGITSSRHSIKDKEQEHYTLYQYNKTETHKNTSELDAVTSTKKP